jgi:hypothetical protein
VPANGDQIPELLCVLKKVNQKMWHNKSLKQTNRLQVSGTGVVGIAVCRLVQPSFCRYQFSKKVTNIEEK